MFVLLEKLMRENEKLMNEKVKICVDLLSDAYNRRVLGVIVLSAGIGIGGGLIASSFVNTTKIERQIA